MDRKIDAGQAGVLPSTEQHRVSTTDLRVIPSQWAEKADAAGKNNDAAEWDPASMLTAVAARLRGGELKAQKAIVVLVDLEAEELTTIAAGTLSTLEQVGILLKATEVG